MKTTAVVEISNWIIVQEENTRTTKPESTKELSSIVLLYKTDNVEVKEVSSADLQLMQVDIEYVHAEDGLHLHGVRVVQDMHEADQSW
ncbi:hypothetical protein Tco_0414145 [Tanacetum coccineum]